MVKFPPFDDMPLNDGDRDVGITWKRRYHLGAYETAVVALSHDSEYPLGERFAHYRLMARWKYPDTPERVYSRSIMISLHDTLYLPGQWEEQMLVEVLTVMTHDVRERFSVAGLPWPECQANV